MSPFDYKPSGVINIAMVSSKTELGGIKEVYAAKTRGVLVIFANDTELTLPPEAVERIISEWAGV